MKKVKPKKPAPRRLPASGGGWAIGNVARIVITTGAPTPAFLEAMIVKSKQGGPR